MKPKPAWLFRQSAAIPFLICDGQVKIVLITANSSGHWIFPKGVVEKGLSAEQSAAKEAMEEAGIAGEISSTMIAEYHYEKWGGTCHVQVFPMRVNKVFDDWEEKDKRDRKIVNVEEALAIVKPILREPLSELIARHDFDRN